MQTIPDGGMAYAETNMEQFFPEPLNFISSLFFLFIALYWTFELRKSPAKHGFLIYAVFLLYIGGIGGSVYHGLRQWPVFIIMDWLPILLLCVSAGLYFIARLTRWYRAAGLLVLFGIGQYYLRMNMGADIQLFININYAMMAALVLLPVLAWLFKTEFRHGKWVGWALAAFVFALGFRVADPWHWLSFGTHFLWHSFGAVAAFCMFRFIYEVDEEKA